MATMPITERDLRLPEFRDCDLADLERCEDGTIARKNRWEYGIREIAGILGMSRGKFEIADVVAAVRSAVEQPQRIVAFIKAAERAANRRGSNSRGRHQHDLAAMSALASTLIEGIERGEHNHGEED